MFFAIISGIPLIEASFFDQHVAFLPSPIPFTPDPPRHFHSGRELTKGQFLIASKDIKDPRFFETVVLLIDYNRRGAIGLIINRPTDFNLSHVLPNSKGLHKREDMLYFGGPVAMNHKQLLIRTKSNPEESHHVFDDVYIMPDLSAIEEMIGDEDEEKRFRVYAGYAGWAPGQLEREVSRGGWHVLRADAKTIFDKVSSEIWPELIRHFDVINITI
jgi:putative transcriptional regulator